MNGGNWQDNVSNHKLGFNSNRSYPTELSVQWRKY